MDRFRREVVKPMVAAERARANAATASLLGRARKLITREQSLVTERQQEQLEIALDQAPTLRKVYEARLALQQIWREKGASMDARLEALRTWCAEAEASGIQALRDFADELKSYTIPQRATA
jgi:transposase